MAVVVVGHSLAGLFVPHAAARRPDRVCHLVLVAAVIPPEGATQRRNLPWAGRIGLRLQTRDGFLRPPPPRLARFLFCNDMDAATADRTVGGLVPEVARLFDEPVTRHGLAPVPATCVRLTRDRAVSARRARRQIRSYGADISVREIDAGHDVMISHPAQLAAVLVECSRP